MEKANCIILFYFIQLFSSAGEQGTGVRETSSLGYTTRKIKTHLINEIGVRRMICALIYDSMFEHC